jgi:ABC-type transport system substrate-binding protein
MATQWRWGLWCGVTGLAVLLGCGGQGTESGGGSGDQANGAASASGKANGSPASANGGSTAAAAGPAGTPDPNLMHFSRGGVEPAESDTLVRQYPDDPDTLNLITSNDNVSSEFQRWVYEYLARREYHDPSQWAPELAESWTFDEEKLEYTIHLRKGVKWHPITLPNGRELKDVEFTSRDVVFTFECIMNEHVEAAALRSYYVDPDAPSEDEKFRLTVNAVDKYTVKIKWRKPYFMADDFTLMVQIMPRHVYSVDGNGEPISFDFRSKEFADGFNNHWANNMMCGTGPVIFKEWKKEHRASLVRNPQYWGQPFYFSDMVFMHESNPNTAVQKLLQREADWGAISQADAYVQHRDDPRVQSGDVRLKDFSRTAYRYLGYNLRRELFKDAKVRWAISHAVPVDEIIDKVYFGLAERVTGPFLPSSMACDKTLVPIPFDLDKSRQLLDEAGWIDKDQNGVREKIIDGEKVEARFDLMIYADSPQYQQIAEIIKENCRKIGLDAQISPAKWALMLQKMRKKEFHAVILGWVSDWKSDPFQIWHGSQADEPESSNSGSYQNPEVDKLIEKLHVTVREEDQWPIYQQIHKLIYEDQPYTFLYADRGLAAHDARIQNIKFYPPLRPHFDVREWYTNKPRRLGK